MVKQRYDLCYPSGLSSGQIFHHLIFLNFENEKGLQPFAYYCLFFGALVYLLRNDIYPRIPKNIYLLKSTLSWE